MIPKEESLDLQKVFDSKDAYAISLRMKILLSIPAFFIAGLVISIFMSYINSIS
ncbi:hypothetical protein [Bacillus sp. EB600]|uniref:hypothetical protein n=1 Tax=Bacillus sp. EB600 TaxID=2806345 RepID=UPI00210870DF|nr:hypothetical protein [Bacillus sp. EB600]MCQ6282701.1 hypothetical protein [Bacillus sp. EB600]